MIPEYFATKITPVSELFLLQFWQIFPLGEILPQYMQVSVFKIFILF